MPSYAPEAPPQAPVTPSYAPEAPAEEPSAPSYAPEAPVQEPFAPSYAPEAPVQEPVSEPEPYTNMPNYAAEAYYMPQPQRQAPPSERYVRTEPPKKKERKVRPAPTGGQKALTVLLCVLLSLTFVVTILVGTVRCLLDEDTIEEIVENVDFDDFEIPAEDGSCTLAEFLHSRLSGNLKKAFSVRNIEKLLEDEDLRDFIAEIAVDYADFLKGADRLNAVDADRVMDFLNDNPEILTDYSPELYHDYDGFCYYDDYNYTYRYLDKEIEATLENTIAFDNLSKSGLRSMLGDSLDLIRFALSPLCYILLIVLCVLMLALIVVINRANIPACFGKVFTTALILGILLLLILAAVLLSGFFLPADIQPAAALISGTLAAFYALRGGILFVVGLVGLILSKKLRKREE